MATSIRLAWVIALVVGLCPQVMAQIGSFGRWQYLGCLYEERGTRILNETFTILPNTTPQFCASYCASIGATISGIEIGDQCFCGTSLTKRISVTASNCNYTCPGDGKQTCGGYGFLQAFMLNSMPTEVPAPTATDETLVTRTTIVLNFGPTPFEGVEVYTSTAGKASTTSTPSGASTTSAPPLQTTVASASGSAPVVASSPVRIQTTGTPRLRDRSQGMIFGQSLT